MKSLQDYLNCLTEQAFERIGLDKKYGLLKMSDRPDLADFQCNGALAAAKEAKKNPRDIAVAVCENLKSEDFQTDIAGPGFINIKVSESLLTKFLNAFDGKVSHPSSKKTTIIDYGGPNVAKPMHVGHLRSSIIGESLKRIMRYVGDDVTGDIHMGDWGTQMGMLIYALNQKFPDLPYFDASNKGPFPKESPVSLDDLQEIYPQISAQCKENETIAKQCRQITFELQQGRSGYRALWQHFVDVSVADMKEQFAKLDVDFDQWFGESRYQDRIAPMLDRLQKEGVIIEDKGALITHVAEEGDKTEIPPILLRKSDGGYLYGTTDLATVEERVREFNVNRIVYVIDSRQRLHCEQVFRAARKAGYNAQYDFVGFGTMNGPDNKPFKTRTGGVMRLSDLIDMLVQEAHTRMEEAGIKNKGIAADEIDHIALCVGTAALKFADLQHDPTQNYQFDIQKFMRFEGKTGPYLLYAAVRIKSLLRKADVNVNDLKINTSLIVFERDLGITLSKFEAAMHRAYEKLSPNVLCDYAFDLAQKFSRFYQECPIMKDCNDATKLSRLKLSALTLQQIEIIAGLLGLKLPERM
jgi:arginyl-tRNA synthetase